MSKDERERESETVRKNKLLLSVVDRHLHEYYRDPNNLSAEQKAEHADLMDMQAELSANVHKAGAPTPTPEATPEPIPVSDPIPAPQPQSKPKRRKGQGQG